MNLFENLQIMKEHDGLNHDYKGKSYWDVQDMYDLFKLMSNKINAIDKNDRMKLFPEFKKYDRSLSFMPKYSIGLKLVKYPSNLHELIRKPNPGTFLDEDECWDVIEDLIAINEYLDKVNIDELPEFEIKPRQYNTHGNTKESLIEYYDNKFPGLKQLINKLSVEVISTDRQFATKTLVLYLDKIDKSIALFDTGYLRGYKGKGTLSEPTNIKKSVDFDYIKKLIEKNS